MSWRAPCGRSTVTPLAALGRCKGAYVGCIRGKIDFLVLHPHYLANSAPQLHQCTGLFFGDSVPKSGTMRQAPETAACSRIYIDVGACDWFARPQRGNWFARTLIEAERI